MDNRTGTSGDDTFSADNTAETQLSVADVIDGGAGTDTLKVYSDAAPGFTIGESITNIENLYINGEVKTLDLSKNGFTSVEFDSDATSAAADHVITVGSGMTITLDSITDGDTAGDGAASGEIEITGASTVTSVALVVDGVGASAQDLDINVTSASITSLSIRSSGTVSTDKNFLGIVNSGAKLDTLTITGDKLLNASLDAVTTLKTITATTSTGGVMVNVTGSTLDVTFTGGTDNDTLIVGADLDTSDVIDGGAGTDTVSISDATLTASTLAAVKGANTLKNVEVLGVSATGTITIDASIFTGINTFSNTAAVSGTEAAGTGARSDGINLTFENGDAFTITAAISGADGSASAGADGGDALEAAAKVNGGTDTITITLNAAAAVSLVGGSATSGGGDGGAALKLSSVEIINIVTASSADDLTLTCVSGSAAGAAGDSISVGANATITITGAGDVNLGTVGTQGAAVDDLTVNGSGMTGVLTVALGLGNDVIKGGSAADVITIGSTAGTATGSNTVTGGAGADTFNFEDGVSTLAQLTTFTDFEMGAGKDIISHTGATVTYEALTSANATLIAADTSLADAVDQAFSQLAANEATAFIYDGAAYVVFEDGTGAGAYTAAADLVIKLAGITSVAAFDATNIA